MNRYQSEEKIAAFFEEFPFLASIVRARKTCEVKVSRVTLDLIKSDGNFYLFDKQGLLVRKTREDSGKTLQDELMLVDRSSVSYIVKVEHTSPNYGGYSWFQRLIGNYAEAVTVYKPPTDFNLADLPEELAKRARQEVEKEIAVA
ncbi:MAG: hypothetical protein AAB361_00265 [Patescibacteria group bacterium]